ncbi:MAG: YHS domain-containing protein [Nitrosarchaeum sp.]|nr:YHS domain-containing protein [Nitrosarchaeum sp.]MBS3925995.1 YHS domain-containing protein [Nitrosarchaeum sp.]
MKVDPVCKMEVEEHGGVTLEYDGNVFHFCCPSCKAVFEKNPSKYQK